MKMPRLRINHADLADLKKAKIFLEKDSIMIKLANFCGYLGKKIGRCLSPGRREKIAAYNVMLIEKSWELAMSAMAPDFPPETQGRHIFYVTVSGAVGGVGILTLVAELPVTTVLMLRAVADIAKEEGEDYNAFDTKLAALEVFALGGDASRRHTGEIGYYAIRDSLAAKHLEESSKDIAKKGAAGIGGPFAVQIIAKVAAKYQTVLSAQITAKALPIVGAIAGAVINIVFLDLFQDKARGHFIMRRLEKEYGAEETKQIYHAVRVSEHTEILLKKEGKEVSEAETDRILRHHVWASMGFGLLPIPLADIAGMCIIQINLLRKLAGAYHIPFSRDAAKIIIAALTGGLFSVSFSGTLAASITKLIPAAGQAAGVIAMPAVAGSATYAIGKVFIQHFASGGTFLNFDPEQVKGYYSEMFQEGENYTRKFPETGSAY